ncbi:MAG: DMT family transporter [Chloroflexi bacterium]|nr:DMT family transporter [Chloroflexota bacterium]
MPNVHLPIPRSSDVPWVVYALVVAGCLLWGGNVVAGRVIALSVPPLTAATLRFGLASLLFLALLRARGLPMWPERRDRARFVWLALCGYSLNNFLFYLGMSYTTAAEAGVVVGANPLITAGLAALILRESLGPTKLTGVSLSVVGVIVVIGTSGDFPFLSAPNAFGDLLLLGNMVTWASYSIYGRDVLRRYSPLAATAYACAFGTALLVPGALLELARTGWPVVTAAVVVAVLYAGTLATVAANVWFYRAIAVLGPSRTGVFMALVPVSAVAISSVLLGEQLAPIQLLGAILVVTGLYVANR